MPIMKKSAASETSTSSPDDELDQWCQTPALEPHAAFEAALCGSRQYYV
jgi:hypothetical protein